jgi:hypothetical protein
VKLALGLVLVASLASGAEPGEATVVLKPKLKAYQLDAPFEVVQDGAILLRIPKGVVLPQAAFEDLDQEFVRLQKLEQVHLGEPSPLGWMLAGSILGGIVSSMLLIGFYVVTR